MTLYHLLRRWKLLVGLAMLGALIALIIAAVQKPRYVANMTISGLGAGESAIQTGLSGAGSGVLQALKGISGGSAASLADGDYGYFISLLKSDRTAALLGKDTAALKLLFPSEWDAEHNVWQRPQGLLGTLKSVYSSTFFGAPYTAPDVPRIKERIADVMSIQFDIENNHHIISVKNSSCARAAELATKIFRSADNVIKDEKGRRYYENIAYLTSQLSDQRNAAFREGLSSSLVLQHFNQISTQSKLPLTVRVIDGPGCSPRPALPQPLAYLVLGAIAGLVLGFALIVWSYLVHHRNIGV